MMATWFLIAGLGFVIGSFKATSDTKKILGKHTSRVKVLPQALTMLIVSAQLSELVRIIEHITIVEISAAGLLLAIAVAAKSGTEGETH